MSDAAGYQWLDTGTYRKRLPADAVPEHWQALHTQTALDAAVAEETERCAQVCRDEIAALKRSGLRDHAGGAQGCLNGIRGV